MTSGIPTPLSSTDSDDRAGLADAVAAGIGGLATRPRLVGFGEPMHGVDEFPRLRNAVFAALVERAGFTSMALETSAWHGRLVDAYVRGADGDEDAVLAAGFTHGFGAFPANRALVRWMREQNRDRPRAEQLRFAAFDAPVEMTGAPSPRPMLLRLHEVLRTHVGEEADLPPWDTIDRLIGPDEPWEEPAAAMEPARSIGADPRVRDLRAIVDDLRRTLDGWLPVLRREAGPDDVEDALLAGRTAAGLLAYHAAMARDTERRWSGLAALRGTMMAENLLATAERGPTLVFAQNAHLRTGTARLAFGPTVLGWQPTGALLADRLGPDYRVLACAFGEAAGHGVPEPAPDTVEGVLFRGLPLGNHRLPAAPLQELRAGSATRVSPNHAYLPVDETLLGEVDEVLFLRSVPAD